MNACAVKESHHFHPLLFYFRFTEPYYSVSKTTTVLLDTVSLMKSRISDDDVRAVENTGGRGT